MDHQSVDGSVAYAFSQAEVRRLAVYKAAVDAGFFSDMCAERTLNAPAGGLSNDDVKRLVEYRNEVQAGLYSEFPVGM